MICVHSRGPLSTELSWRARGGFFPIHNKQQAKFIFGDAYCDSSNTEKWLPFVFSSALLLIQSSCNSHMFTFIK